MESLEEGLVDFAIGCKLLCLLSIFLQTVFQGVWSPKKIENPDYFEDNEPFKMTSIVSGIYRCNNKYILFEFQKTTLVITQPDV